MSHPKRFDIRRIRHIEGSMEADLYVYPPGLAWSEAAKALIDGRILGTRCAEGVYLPPRLYCRDLSRGELVEVSGSWIVKSYTIIYEDMRGRRLEEPQTLILAAPEGVLGGLIHLLKTGARPEIGMAVRPVFRPREERRGTLSDILYFEPVRGD